MRLSEWLSERGDNRWLARELGVTEQTVSRWKSGVHVPRGKDIRQILILSKGKVTASDFYPTKVSR